MLGSACFIPIAFTPSYTSYSFPSKMAGWTHGHSHRSHSHRPHVKSHRWQAWHVHPYHRSCLMRGRPRSTGRDSHLLKWVTCRRCLLNSPATCRPSGAMLASIAGKAAFESLQLLCECFIGPRARSLLFGELSCVLQAVALVDHEVTDDDRSAPGDTSHTMHQDLMATLHRLVDPVCTWF